MYVWYFYIESTIYIDIYIDKNKKWGMYPKCTPHSYSKYFTLFHNDFLS